MKGLITLALVSAVAIAAAAPPQLVVRLQPTADPVGLSHAYGIEFVERTPNAPFALYAIPANLDPETIQAKLEADRRVVWAEDNIQVSSPEGQSALKGSTMPAIGGRTALYAANSHVLEQINWSPILANSPGRTVRVAILDTGIAEYHRYLWGKVDARANFIERDLAPVDCPRNEDSNGNGIPDEEVGHGTMIAGIIDQIAPQTRLIIARVADSDGIATAWTVIEGLAFSVTNGAEVANLSLGSPNQVPALRDVLDWCEDNHLLVVAGAGNADLPDAYFPAQIHKVVCVTGLNPNNTKADFSNWDGGARSAAPATGIVSQWWDGHMGIWSGTSFSSPMVAAALADCLRRTTGTLSLNDLRDAIEESGRNIDPLNPEYRGKLGTLLDIQSLDSVLSHAGRGRLISPARGGRKGG